MKKKKLTLKKNDQIIKTADGIYVKRKRTRLKSWVIWLFFLGSLISVGYTGIQIFIWSNDNKKIAKLEAEINNMTYYEFIEEDGTFFNPPEEIPKQTDEDKQTPTYISDYWYYVTFPFTK